MDYWLTDPSYPEVSEALPATASSLHALDCPQPTTAPVDSGNLQREEPSVGGSWEAELYNCEDIDSLQTFITIV
jgi:hypothetical protein